MENSSFYAAFERMWLHILGKFNNYVSTEALDNYVPTEVLDNYVSTEVLDNYVQTEALDNYVPTEVLDNHTSDMENPHAVTAEQVGALPIGGGVMENTLTLNGIVLTEGIDYGSGDPGGGVLGQLYFKKVT